MEEEFKPVPGWEGKYSIGTRGTVLSHLHEEEKVLKHKITKQGYHYVSLSTGWIKPSSKAVGISRMMAAAFIPNPNDWSEVGFINGDKADLRIENLKWIMHDSNSRKKPSYIYEIYRVDAPHDRYVCYSVRDIQKITGLGNLTIANYLLRHPGEPGSTGWVISCKRRDGFGTDRIGLEN